MNEPHILVVDDHRDIREPLAAYLRKHGMRVSQAADTAAARASLAKNAIDMIVLDIMMPGEDGLSLCRHVREAHDIPIILLTAMTDETDRIVGLESERMTMWRSRSIRASCSPASRTFCGAPIRCRRNARPLQSAMPSITGSWTPGGAN